MSWLDDVFDVFSFIFFGLCVICANFLFTKWRLVSSKWMKGGGDIVILEKENKGNWLGDDAKDNACKTMRYSDYFLPASSLLLLTILCHWLTSLGCWFYCLLSQLQLEGIMQRLRLLVVPHLP